MKMKFFNKKDLKIFTKQQEKDIKMSKENEKKKNKDYSINYVEMDISNPDEVLKINTSITDEEITAIASKAKKDWDEYNNMRMKQYDDAKEVAKHIAQGYSMSNEDLNASPSGMYNPDVISNSSASMPLYQIEPPSSIWDKDLDMIGKEPKLEEKLMEKEIVDEDADTLITINIDTLTDYLVQMEINLGHHYGLVTQELKDAIFDKHYDYIYEVLALNTKKVAKDMTEVKAVNPVFTSWGHYTGPGGYGFTGSVGGVNGITGVKG